MHAEMAQMLNETAMLELAKMINCSVCNGILNNAKLLPCGHSFCLKCLQLAMTVSHGNNADQFACPVCKSNFAVPTGNLDSLPQNVYLEGLLKLRNMLTVDEDGSGDERTMSDDDNTDQSACYGCQRNFAVPDSPTSPRSPVGYMEAVVLLANKLVADRPGTGNDRHVTIGDGPLEDVASVSQDAKPTSQAERRNPFHVPVAVVSADSLQIKSEIRYSVTF